MMPEITVHDIAIRDDLLDQALALKSDINAQGCYMTAADKANAFVSDGMNREDAITQAVEMVEAVLREIVASTKPWTNDADQHQRM